MDDMFKQMQEMMAFNPMFAPQVEHFWEAQEDLLNETEAFAKHWFSRRHEATRTAMAAAKAVTMSGGANPAIAMQALTDWQTHSVQRVAEDTREWLDLVSRCTAHITRAELEAGGESVEKAGEQAASLTSRKKSVPL